jgi:hypothetical protein
LHQQRRQVESTATTAAATTTGSAASLLLLSGHPDTEHGRKRHDQNGHQPSASHLSISYV